MSCVWLALTALACADGSSVEPAAVPDAGERSPLGDAALPMGMDAAVPPPQVDGGVPVNVADGGDAGAVRDAAVTGSAPSHGGTITFQEIGSAGWYPSRRDPASGECDAIDTDTCCMTRHELTSDALAPWDEDLIVTLRGPMSVQRMAVYQPLAPGSGDWSRVAAWSASAAASGQGFSFDGDATPGTAFAGTVGNQCLVDVARDEVFPCGPGSVPYCPAGDRPKHAGWTGAKLIVLLASMPHVGDGAIAEASNCSNDAADNWYDAPWIGISHGELVRSGKFGDCHCYAKDPAMWWLGDGCGQFNAFEVVNDNNASKNLELFSTNFFGYGGYVGEGPCGEQCDVSALPTGVDLIDKSRSAEASAGAIATLEGGPGAAFVRPSGEPRYFIVLFEPGSRTVQLALVSPASVPEALAALLPSLPERLEPSEIASVRDLRLPH